MYGFTQIHMYAMHAHDQGLTTCLTHEGGAKGSKHASMLNELLLYTRKIIFGLIGCLY
jgi:hypothetical protein